MAPTLPGPGGSEGGAGGTWGGWVLGSRGLHPSQTPRAPQLPDGCFGHRPRRPSSGWKRGWGGRGDPVRSSCRRRVPLGGPGPASPPPPRPQHVVKPRVFRCPPVGGAAGASTSSLLLAPGFGPLARPGAHSSLHSRPSPTWPSVCSVVALLLAPEKCPPSEPSIWEASVRDTTGLEGVT